jgi:transposase
MSKKGEEQEWVRVAEEFEASGLRQREFAQSRGLRLSTLQSWIYRRRRQVSTEAPPPVRLLPVQVSPAPRATEDERVEVATGSGLRVRFRADTDVDYVARLVTALERSAC